MQSSTLEVPASGTILPTIPVLDEEIERKLRRMTLIVGLIGSDGVVIAADQNMIDPASNATTSVAEQNMDDTMHGCKIDYFETHAIVCAYAGDLLARHVGAEICAEIENKTFGFRDIKGALEYAGNRGMSNVYANAENSYGVPRIKRAALIVFHGPQVTQRQLWRLNIDTAHSNAERVTGAAVIGAWGNEARFFRHYFEAYTPVERLKMLSAHVIMAGHKATGLIDGLDMAVVDDLGFRWIGEDEKDTLRKRSKRLDESIREQLFRA